MKKHTVQLTTKELETLIYHLDTDLNDYGVNGSWGDGEGFIDDSLENYGEQPNIRTKRGEKILIKLKRALWNTDSSIK